MVTCLIKRIVDPIYLFTKTTTMAKCKYCGENAGFFRSKHKECEKKNLLGKSDIQFMIDDALQGKQKMEGLKDRINKIASECNISDDDVKSNLFFQFDLFAFNVVDKGLLSEDQETRVALFMNEMGVKQSFLDKYGAFSKLLKSKIIRQITNGEVPEGMQEVVHNTPFMLNKGEYLIWIYTKDLIHYFEQTTSTHYTGGHAGLGIRVAKGLYFRTGGFKGKPVHTTDMKYITSGMFGLTNKNIYFYGAHTSLRVPYNKIITVYSYEDGVGLQQEGSRKGAQVFSGVDGWFVYNLIANMKQKQ